MSRLVAFFTAILLVSYDVNGQSIYFTDESTDKIQRAPVDGIEMEVVLDDGIARPTAISIDFANNKIYWVDPYSDVVQRCNLDGSGLETIITTSVLFPADIFVDSSNAKLYWADGVGLGGIQRANLDGTERETVVSVRALSFALDDSTGKLYWCEYNGQFGRANLDGSEVEIIPINPQQAYLDVDSADGKLYWASFSQNKIQRSNLDGSNVETLLAGPDTHMPKFLEIDKDGGWLYWVDRCNTDCAFEDYRIMRSRFDGSGLETIVQTKYSTPYSIALHQPSQKLFWSTTTTGLHFGAGILKANIDGSGVEDLVSSGLQTLRRISLDLVNGKMYWTDVGTDKIQRSSLDGSNVEDLVTTDLAFPTGIALDIPNGKMYWSDDDNPVIRRANLDGTDIEVLVDDEESVFNARGMALDLQRGKMYWANVVESNYQGFIVRANLDGSSFETVVESGPNPLGVSLDVNAGKIYWTRGLSDGFLPPAGYIHRANLDGSNSEQLAGGAADDMYTPLELALDTTAGKMYWTDGGTGKIQRANLDGSGIEDVVMGLGTPRGIALDPGPRIISSFPPGCAVDAREPHAIHNAEQIVGWNSITLIFNYNITAIVTDLITVSEVGGDGIAPAIASMEILTDSAMRVTLSEPIGLRAWTCLHYSVNGNKTCLGYLPGDVNGDGRSSPVDILSLIDSLNGVVDPPIEEWKTDINRSGATEPADILRLIDLLMGAEAFEVWNGQVLAICP